LLFANLNDVSGDSWGVYNTETQAVDAVRNWWGSSFGPNTSASSDTFGAVNFSPWLGDTQSIKLPTPDSLGFTSSAALSYTVTASTKDPKNPTLLIQQVNSQAAWNVTPSGNVVFVGNGAVTINGQSGTGFDTDAFILDTPSGAPSSVTFASNDAFNKAIVFFSGTIATTVAAKGTTNSFDVSAWTGTATLTAPAGSATTILATKSFGTSNTSPNVILSDTSMTSTDGTKLTLSGINTAQLTVNSTATSLRAASAFLDATKFTGVNKLTAGGTGKVIVFGGGTAASTSSTLTATGAHDVLIGGPGKNTLNDSSTGYNILIGGGGGTGSVGNEVNGNGNDILISGTTDYDGNNANNIAALDAFLNQWGSTTTPYGTRINNLINGIGTYKLNGTTVHWNKKSNNITNGISTPSNWLLVNQNGDSYTKLNQTLTNTP
jgi:hypothetical protein